MKETLEDFKTGASEDPIGQLKKAIVIYDTELAESAAKQVLEQGIDPFEAFNAMTEAIRLVGDAFGQGELWLPDLICASETMSAATPIIEEEIKRRGAKRESVGTIVIGTVQGDIHSIGKTMVAALLTAEGFDVRDLGIDITAEAFVEAIKTYEADVLALSALLTTTAPEQRKVIETLKQQGLREKVKIMVGGGAINAEFAENIGADGYDPTAPGAAKLARRLLGKEA